MLLIEKMKAFLAVALLMAVSLTLTDAWSSVNCYATEDCTGTYTVSVS